MFLFVLTTLDLIKLVSEFAVPLLFIKPLWYSNPTLSSTLISAKSSVVWYPINPFANSDFNGSSNCASLSW